MYKKILPLLWFQMVTLCQGNAQATWTQKADLAGTARENAIAFGIGNKGYIGTGAIGSFPYYLQDLWEYDPVLDAWSQKADLSGTAREYAIAFSIGNKGYVGTGYSGYPDFAYLKDFWEYDQLFNVWIQKADFGGGALWDAVGFSIGDKGYVGTGMDSSGYSNSFWEFDPNLDVWLQKAEFPGTARVEAVGFSIGSKGYIGTGYATDGYKKDFWEFDPILNVWMQKADFAGTARWLAVGFGTSNNGYIGTGADLSTLPYLKDFWKYDPFLNTWTQQPELDGEGRYDAVAFSLGDNGYVGTGAPVTGGFAKDFWEFAPQSIGISSVANTKLQLSVFPDPAMDITTIQFTLPRPLYICVQIYDIRGKEILTLVNEDIDQGSHSHLLNINHLTKGVYMVRMVTDLGIENKKLIVQ